VWLIKHVVALIAQTGTAKAIRTAHAILAKPYFAARATVSRKEYLVGVADVDRKVAKLTNLAVDCVEALFTPLKGNIMSTVFSKSSIKTQITVFRPDRGAVVATH
jgi:hypothetical protein